MYPIRFVNNFLPTLQKIEKDHVSVTDFMIKLLQFMENDDIVERVSISDIIIIITILIRKGVKMTVITPVIQNKKIFLQD